jgi:hypothetical protein
MNIKQLSNQMIKNLTVVVSSTIVLYGGQLFANDLVNTNDINKSNSSYTKKIETINDTNHYLSINNKKINLLINSIIQEELPEFENLELKHVSLFEKIIDFLPDYMPSFLTIEQKEVLRNLNLSNQHIDLDLPNDRAKLNYIDNYTKQLEMLEIIKMKGIDNNKLKQIEDLLKIQQNELKTLISSDSAGKVALGITFKLAFLVVLLSFEIKMRGVSTPIKKFKKKLSFVK